MPVDLSGIGDPERPRLGPVQRALILRSFSGFAGLPREDLALLASICRERYYTAGEVMHEPGKPVTAFHLVVDGDVEMYQNGRPVRVLTGRSTVGALAALGRDPRGAHAVAKSDVYALMMDTEDMEEVFEDNCGIIFAVMRSLGFMLRDAQMQAGGGAAVDTRKRIDAVDVSTELSLVDKMFILKKATNFADVSVEAIAQMARDAEEVRYAAGAEIWPVGPIAQWSMLVVDGVVACIPEDKPPFRFGPSFYVGSLDALTESPRWYACRAETDVTALRIVAHRLLDTLEDHTDMALEMLRNFARGATALLERQAAAMAPNEARERPSR